MGGVGLTGLGTFLFSPVVMIAKYRPRAVVNGEFEDVGIWGGGHSRIKLSVTRLGDLLAGLGVLDRRTPASCDSGSRARKKRGW